MTNYNLFQWVASHGHRCCLHKDGTILIWVIACEKTGQITEECFQAKNMNEARIILGY